MNILRVSGVLQRQSLIVELAFADLDNVDFLYFSISLIGTLQFLIRQAIYMKFVEYLPNNPIILNQK